jgi:uncharacterized protein
MKKVSSKRDAILVFTKGTNFGQVKTRLQPFLNDQQSMDLHLAFLQDTLQKIESLKIHSYLYVVGDSNFHFTNPFPVFQQIGQNLGSRLQNAFEAQFQKYARIVVIGTDSPDLPVERIQEALASLQNHDAVIGQSDDGGYYLLGLSKMIPEVFQNIPWSTNQVFERTLEKLQRYKTHILERHYDVDVIEDLLKLKTNLEKEKSIALHTRRWFEKNWNEIMRRLNDKLQNAPE